MEPIQHATSSSFALGIMKIQVGFLCHTIVLDKDSKFFGVFKEAVDLLQINRHVLSGGNHNGLVLILAGSLFYGTVSFRKFTSV
jgi:hypothetical protein